MTDEWLASVRHMAEGLLSHHGGDELRKAILKLLLMIDIKDAEIKRLKCELQRNSIGNDL